MEGAAGVYCETRTCTLVNPHCQSILVIELGRVPRFSEHLQCGIYCAKYWAHVLLLLIKTDDVTETTKISVAIST